MIYSVLSATPLLLAASDTQIMTAAQLGDRISQSTSLAESLWSDDEAWTLARYVYALSPEHEAPFAEYAANLEEPTLLPANLKNILLEEKFLNNATQAAKNFMLFAFSNFLDELDQATTPILPPQSDQSHTISPVLSRLLEGQAIQQAERTPTLTKGKLHVKCPVTGNMLLNHVRPKGTRSKQPDDDIRIGDRVKKGQVLGIVSSMKMEIRITAPLGGRVTWVNPRFAMLRGETIGGTNIAEGTVLYHIKPRLD